MLGPLTGLINPYLTYIKIGVVLAAIGALVGGYLYIEHVFTQRKELQALSAKLAADLQMEQQKYGNLLQQTNMLMETNKKIVEAVQRVKINSNVYIDRVEAAHLVAPVTGGTVFIPGGVPKAVPGPAAMPIFSNNTSNRSAAGTAGS